MGVLAQQGGIAGIVEANGQPLPGVLVGAQLVTNNSSDPPPAVTTVRSDQNGSFLLAGLKPGKYILAILSPGWVTIKNSPTRSSAQDVEVEINNNTIESLKLNAVKGGVITGRVTTERGQPIIGVSVDLTPALGFNSNKMARSAIIDRLVSTKKYQTDDRGVYRIYGLLPGSYIVSVGSSGPGDNPFPLTYYPVGSANGEPVTIRPGEETSGIDLIISTDKTTYMIQGRLLDARTEKLMPDVPIKYVTRSSSGVMSTRLATHSDAYGVFMINGLEPGKYTIVIGKDQLSSYKSSPLDIEIIDRDITGLELKVRQSTSISGTVVIEGDNTGATNEVLSRLRLRAQLEENIGHFTTIQIKPDGSFEVVGLDPGRVRLALALQESSRGWWINGIEYRGEMMLNGILLQDEEQIAGVRVRLTRGSGQVKGRVVFPENLPLSNIRMSVVAQSTQPGLIGNARPGLVGSDGTFEIAGLAPGSYRLRLMAPSAPEQMRVILQRTSGTVAVNNNSIATVNLVIAPEK